MSGLGAKRVSLLYGTALRGWPSSNPIRSVALVAPLQLPEAERVFSTAPATREPCWGGTEPAVPAALPGGEGAGSEPGCSSDLFTSKRLWGF